MGDPKRFGPVALEVLAEARRDGGPEELVVALRAVAWFERFRLQNAAALTLLDEAVRAARRAALPHRLGEVLITRAAVNLELGRVDAAARDLDRATPLAGGAAAPELELKRATLLHNLGRMADAARVYRRLLNQGDLAVDVRTRAANNLGLVQLTLGRAHDALRNVDLAARLAPDVGPAFVALVAHNRGLVLAESGRLAESMAQFERSTALLTEAGLPLGESCIELAETFAALRVLPEAQKLAERAVAELADVPLMAAEARLKAAEIALLSSDSAAALDAADAAAAQFRRQRRTAWAAMATIVSVDAGLRTGPVTRQLMVRAGRAADVLARLGDASGAVVAEIVAGRVAMALGRSAIARRRLHAAFERSRRGPVLVRVRGRLAAALAADLDGDRAAVLAHCRSGLVDLARHRSALTSMELRALASGHGVELGQLGLAVLLGSGSAGQVLGWTERTRAAALLTVEPPAPDAVREERAELAVVQAELAQARRETGTEPAGLVARQTAVEERIRRGTWFRGSTSAGAAGVAGLAQLRTALGDRALVSYGAHAGELFAVVRHGRRRARLVRLGPVDGVRFETDALLFALRRLTRPGSPAATAAARASAEHSVRCLAELLVRPLGLPGDVALVVVPEGSTNRVPWSALHLAPVSVAPSASLWARTATRPAGPGGEVLLVAGPRLSGAAREVAAVAALHAGATVVVPPEATVTAVVDALARADLAHLACHGLLRADNPTFSALELVDGQLTVHELDLRGIAPRRVVLAACDSAADVSYDGGELLGFVSALLARGTAGLVASVVAVGDVEAVALMRALHEGLAAGATMAQALHAARTRIDTADPRAFVNWCAFTAYGAG